MMLTDGSRKDRSFCKYNGKITRKYWFTKEIAYKCGLVTNFTHLRYIFRGVFTGVALATPVFGELLRQNL